jgi:hypothetical protein
VPRKIVGERRVELPGLEKEPARLGSVLGAVRIAVVSEQRVQRQAGVDLVLGGAAHQVVEEAAHLAHVARRFRQAFLVRVELFEHDHR